MQTCSAYREEHVLLVLIDSTRVRHGVSVFDDRDRFTYEGNKWRKVISLHLSQQTI